MLHTVSVIRVNLRLACMRVVQQSALICEAAQSHLHVCVCAICWYFVEERFKGAAVGEQRFNQH